jgi:hypothetical protein
VRLAGALVVLFLASTLIACGDDDGTPSTTTAAPTFTNNAGGGDATDTADATNGEEATTTPKATATEDGGNVGCVPNQSTTCDTSGAACKLLTEEEVESEAGIDVEATTDEEFECNYEAIDPSTVYSADLTFKHGSHADMKEYYDIEVGESVPIDGLGDEAKWAEGLGLLEVLQGEYEYDLQIVAFVADVPDELQQAKEMAGHISGRLP